MRGGSMASVPERDVPHPRWQPRGRNGAREARWKERAVLMRHAAAVYLGCAGLLIGGTGLTYEKLAARNPAPTATNTAANDTALFVQASLAAAPTPADWPPQNAAVAH